MDPGNKYGQLILDLPELRKNVARYMWSIFAKATHFRLSDFPETPFVLNSAGLFPVSDTFDDFLSGKIEIVVSRYQLPEGLPDFRKEEPLACAFYLINSLHETLLSSDKLDKYDRYPYQESIQFTNDLIERNYVQEIFDELYQKITGNPPEKVKSKLMWSHDIDYLYSAWKTDLILAYQKREYHRIPGILWHSLTHPHRWNNVEHILELEQENDIQSIFFWLTEQKKCSLSDTIYIDHADYSFHSKSIKSLWKKVLKAGSQNGLHKSAFNFTFDQELLKLPNNVFINRNHFLKISVNAHYEKIEKSGLKYDATLGFPDHYGFRNSFGQPFQPYNTRENQPYRFMEIPLHLMDTTFRTYLTIELQEMMDKMFGFIQRHRYSCVISLLIHNSQFNFQDEREVELWKQFYSSLQDFESYMPEKV